VLKGGLKQAKNEAHFVMVKHQQQNKIEEDARPRRRLLNQKDSCGGGIKAMQPLNSSILGGITKRVEELDRVQWGVAWKGREVLIKGTCQGGGDQQGPGFWWINTIMTKGTPKNPRHTFR